MANASAKKQATANVEALKTLHLTSLGINVLVLLSHFIFQRPQSIKPYAVFTTFALFLQFQIERMGRPKYDRSRVQAGTASVPTLISPGDDLSSPGLIEWIHDGIYVTWICDILSIALSSNKVWYLFLAIPVYATYRVYNLVAGKGGLLGGLGGLGGAGSKPETEEPYKASKRQEKLQKKQQKFGAN